MLVNKNIFLIYPLKKSARHTLTQINAKTSRCSKGHKEDMRNLVNTNDTITLTT